MIRTRFAPSPTGFLHIGGARTALFAYAFARKYKGIFILRIEDTDTNRSTKESALSITDAMAWLKLTHDEGPYYQSQRQKRYAEVAQQLLQNGHAYYCYCSQERLEQMRTHQLNRHEKPKYDRRCLTQQLVANTTTTPVIRFKNPDQGSVQWHDAVKGKITINNSELDDLIIVRSDGTPTYNFCVAVDDYDMQISHVIRGDDHVNNTPRQINILNALNAPIPQYAHIPMILNATGQKMSKRQDAVSVMQYQEMGILPEALLNYLARLCFGHGNDEIFNLEQFIAWFSLDAISHASARFDMQKLLWVNSQHLKLIDNATLASLLHDRLQPLLPIINNSTIVLTDVIELIKPRVNELNTLATNCAYFYQPKQLTDEDQYLTTEARQLLQQFKQDLSNNHNLLWQKDSLKLFLNDFCHNHAIKLAAIGMPLRLALCGTTQTPPLDALLAVLGRNIVLDRLPSPQN